MMADLRQALRGLRRTPGFSFITVLSLAVAIGANGAIFSLIDGLWFRPPGVRDPGSLVWIYSTTADQAQGTFSYPEYRDLQSRTTSFAGVVARGRRGALLNNGSEPPELLLVNVVTTNFFSVLGVEPYAGRLFAPGDEASLEQQPGVVLGHAFWRRRFGADPAVVGRTIVIGRERPQPVVVLGVLPASLRDLDAAADRDLWMPPQTWVRQAGREELEPRDYRWFDVLAMLRPGVTPAAARLEAASLAKALSAAYPATNAGRGVTIHTDRQRRLDAGGVNAVALFGVVLFVMLITCVNVANLLLARAATRTREVATRLALGATRVRIVRELLAESLLLGTGGALAGAVVSVWLIAALPAAIVPPPGLPSFLLFAADQRMAIVTLVVTLVTVAFVGVVPGLAASRVDLVPLMKGEWTMGSPSRPRAVRRVLTVVQVAVSLALVCSAVVLGRSFFETRRADIGFARKPIVTAWCTFTDVTPVLERDAVARLEALPGVLSVAVAIRAPLSLSGGGMTQPVAFHDRQMDPAAGLPAIKYNAVSASYFHTMGTRVIRGRTFADAERNAPVVVVNEAFADRYFGGKALDRLVTVNNMDRRIVGVVQNAVINQIGEPAEPYLYVPFTSGGEMTFLVEAASGIAIPPAVVRDTLRRVDERLTPRRIVTMSELIEYSAGDYRMTAALVAALGAIGLLLTTMGVYGVVAYNTTQRARELGIRSAVGATRRQIIEVVFADGLRLTLFGLAMGLPLALIATRALASFLFSTPAWDPASFALAGALVAAATALASIVPALRASRTNLTDALRQP